MADLAELLSGYCNQLLGEESSQSKAVKTKKKTKKKNKDFKEETKEKEVVANQNESRVTEDGFKIVSEIPLDDSDLSFDEDIEDTNDIDLSTSCFGSHTEDGFKIISAIPSDDSDISDAFESDIDETAWLEEVKGHKKLKRADTKLESKVIQSNFEENSTEKSNLSNIKTPLRKLIEDFGMAEKIALNKDSMPYLNSSSSATNVKCKTFTNKDLKIVDHSSKRNAKKKTPKDIKSKEVAPSREELQKEMKKSRYEVFKFGISGFAKENKEKAKIDTLIRLGAKPPKKKCVNYKDFIEERKLQKQKAIEKREEDRRLGMPVKKAPVKKERKPGGAGELNPLMGKFKDGVLTLSKKDMQKFQ